MIASLLYSASQKAAAPGRIAIVVAFAAAVAVITGVAAGPVLTAIPSSHVLPLVLCFFLVTAVVGLSAVAIQALVGKLGSLVVALLFIIVGGSAAGGGGVALLPTYWQTIGGLLPPRHAVELYRNVRYSEGHNVITPIAVLLVYGLVSLVIIVVMTARQRGSQRRARGGCRSSTPGAQGPCRPRRVLADPHHLVRVQLHELRP